MDLIILAGGRGTRLQSLVNDRPKPMAIVDSEPFLAKILSYVSNFNFDQIIISVGYMSEVITSYFGHEYLGIPIKYAFEKSALGTGGAVVNSLQYCTSDKVMIMNGDTFVDVDFDNVIRHSILFSAPTIVAVYQDSTDRFGFIKFNDDGLHVSEFLEKQESCSGFINSGVYIISANDILKCNFQLPFSFEKCYLTQLVSRNSLVAYKHLGHFLDIGVPADYKYSSQFFANLTK